MIITSPNTPPPNNQKRWLKIIVKIVVLLLVLGGIGFLIWHLGSPKIHT
jgi:flagellar basal body-associated protein FliL